MVDDDTVVDVMVVDIPVVGVVEEGSLAPYSHVVPWVHTSLWDKGGSVEFSTTKKHNEINECYLVVVGVA